ncbi:MAG: S1 RNA-binding domain-containing protein [Actinomycetia bacterium]|nr:S1 RNA-binding domain-containing protein [Actinomycetes bacterium]MCP4960570.1 S1 RNA-binding domain-containing protein [Actinomycetes bacterium]
MTTHLVVDGSNIATEGRKTPSLKQLEEAVKEFLVERPHDHVVVMVDASFPNRIDKSELGRYEKLVDSGWLITPPAGAIGRGDAFILRVAIKADARVLSNDSFQEFHGDHDWLFEEGRLVGGKPVPAVGWVFVDRAPVRGATSRRAVRDAKRKESSPPPSAPEASVPEPPKASTRRRTRKVGDKSGESDVPMPPASPAQTADKPTVNQPAEFVAFVASNLPGSTVTAIVDSFTSHGAYAKVGSTTCYVPLRLMGDPPPRSARDVLEVGDSVEFIVQSTDPARNAIDLALVPNDETPKPPRKAPVKRKRAAKKTAAKKTTAKTTAKKTAAKKTTAKKTAAKKTAAKKTAAKKQTAEKVPVGRSAKKTTAQEAPTDKGAKKASSRKRTAKKAATKKAGTTKAPAKRTVTRKRSASKN